MDKKLALGALLGLILGILAGVETIQYADARACPQPACLEKTEVIPVSDRGYLPQVHEILQNAESSIHMAMFELKYYSNFKNSSANIIVEDLIQASKRGVEVKIIVDEFSERDNAYKKLKENGIEIKMDSQNTTTHAKLIIVDGRVVVLGSTNLSFYGLEKNNEINVILISQQAAEYYEQYFWNLWNEG
jgi:phosphatidylserine/phosphatidylglycerophosphate/cardiolipin synthase-like enzyme